MASTYEDSAVLTVIVLWQWQCLPNSEKYSEAVAGSINVLNLRTLRGRICFLYTGTKISNPKSLTNLSRTVNSDPAVQLRTIQAMLETSRFRDSVGDATPTNPHLELVELFVD